MKVNLTAIIIAKNEEKMLVNCLETLNWCEQIIVVDNGSIDATADLAEKNHAQVISFEHKSFAKLREQPLKEVKTDWIMYIDPDERITPSLAGEIAVKIETKQSLVFALKRTNIFYGKEFNYGGWNNEIIARIFHKSVLKGWQGEIHESAIYSGIPEILKIPLIHLSHRNTRDGLLKTIDWTAQEAKLLNKSKKEPVTFFTILRKSVMEFLRRAILAKGYKDGLEGLIESLIQAMNKMLIYIQIWEMQKKPSLDDIYQKKEIEIAKLWEKSKEKS